jgi:hypothetical protein
MITRLLSSSLTISYFCFISDGFLPGNHIKFISLYFYRLLLHMSTAVGAVGAAAAEAAAPGPGMKRRAVPAWHFKRPDPMLQKLLTSSAGRC